MRVDGEGGDDAPAPAEKPSTSARSWDPPPTLAFLTHLTRPGGYGLDASDVRTSVSAWREAEIVATLVRNAKRKAPDAVVGRIFTAVNQDGIVVLIGEAGRGDDAGGGGGSTARRDDESDDERHLRDCHLSVCHLDPPVNLGAPDGRNARAVMLVMVPDDGPSKEAPWARGMDQHGAMRTIKAAFHGFARHGALLKSIDRAEKTAESDRGKAMIADLIGAVSGGFTPRAGSGSGEESVFTSPEKREPSLDGGGGKSGGARKSLSLEHDHRKPSSKKSHVLTPEEYVRAIQTAIGSYVAAEEQKQRRKRAAEDDAESESDYEGKPQWAHPGGWSHGWTPTKIGGGLMNDVKNRFIPHYASDWTDGLSMKTVSAALLMFFGCLAPCIAFGALTSIETDGKMGTTEYILAQAVAGIFFSLVAGQPEIVLRTTGPSTVFLIELNAVCDRYDAPFATTYAWTGIWASLFMVIIALTDACVLMLRNCTRFTQEIFGLFVSAIFISAGLGAFVRYFRDDEHDLAQAFFSLILGVLTLHLGLWALAVRTSPFLLKFMRELTADFGIAAAITISSLVAWGSDVNGMEMLDISDDVEPADGRNWVVNLYSGPSWIPAFAIIPAFLLALLMYVEMNISSLLANKAENNLIKGAAYHQNFLVMALITLAFSFFGLPPMTGSLPHSPQFIRALSDVEEITVGGQTKTKVLWVRENRIAPLLVNVLIFLSLVMTPLLREIPMAVLYGLFLYLGITGLATSQFWTRIKMIFMDPRLLPPTHYVRRVPISRVHAFTFVQLACLGMLIGVRASPAALFFPLFIAILMPLRRFLSWKNIPLFTSSMLRMLDMIAEGSNAEAAYTDGDRGAGGLGLSVSDWEAPAKGATRNSYLDLRTVGPDVNGAELVPGSPLKENGDVVVGAKDVDVKVNGDENGAA
jgi:hypothetical protein